MTPAGQEVDGCRHRITHRHGTRMAYTTDRCRCPQCTAAQSRYVMHRSKLIAYGRWSSYNLVDAAGSRRRLQALMWLGWSCPAISAETGIHKNILRRLTQQPRVTSQHALALAEAYDRLWDTRPPDADRVARAATHKIRAYAARNGFLPPMAWDDDSIDDPAAEPYATQPVDVDPVAVEQALAGRNVRLTRRERVEAVRVGTQKGMTAEAVGQRIGRTARTVERDKAA